MLVFVDESGCTGFKFDNGSSEHFVVVAVIFDDREQAKLCDEAIRALRDRCNWTRGHEFRFSKIRHSSRVQFFETVAPFAFRYFAFVLNKRRLMDGALRQKRRMYTKTITWLFENAAPTLREATVILDAHGNREFTAQISQFLQIVIRRSDGHRPIAEVRSVASHSDNLVQLADMIAGAVRHCYNHAQPDCAQYWRMVKDHQRQNRSWP